jgi:hypothetical protein
MPSSIACDSLGTSNSFQASSLQFNFQFGKQSENTGGYAQRVGKMGYDNHDIVSHKFCGFQGRVGGGRVVVREPVVLAPKFRSFSHRIFSQASQNVTVKIRVHHSVRRNKFTVNNPLHVEKQWACSLLNSGPAAPFLLLVIVNCSTATIVASFLDYNRKSKCRHPL